MNNDEFVSPFSQRYASKEMQFIFSNNNKFRLWRRLWISLAKAERRAGLSITAGQIAQLEQYADDINYEEAIERERQVRHDVMAHVFAFGQQAPEAKGIIHLGATSCYVGDNADLIIMREALKLVQTKLVGVISLLGDFAKQYADLPCLGYTHLQPAQLTTVGKRATLWLNDLVMDLEDVEHRMGNLRLLGSKGTTGTQASFSALFGGDDEKVAQVEEDIARDFGFPGVVPVSGQTYSRKIDFQVLSVLSGLAQSASKFANDLRILQSFKEMEEPFAKHQIGSSAMPYKRNPMRCERITALARYVMVDSLNPAFTAATQWFERTLDDSANKRIAVAEAFLAVDGILDLLLNVCDGLVVYPKVIAARVWRELPFMATENIMMEAVKRGGDRQELHEKLRTHSMAAAKVVKEEGGENDLMSRIVADPDFGLSAEEGEKILAPGDFVGLAPKQVATYLAQVIAPLLSQRKDLQWKKAELQV